MFTKTVKSPIILLVNPLLLHRNDTWQGELKLTGPIVIEVTKILEMFYIILAHSPDRLID